MPASPEQRAFTLLELLATIAIIALIGSFCLAGLSRGKGKATKIFCNNNLRQLSLALEMYATDNEENFPRRTASSRSNWVVVLQPNYVTTNILRCHVERDGVWRSYLLNGFNDWFKQNLTAIDYSLFELWQWPRGLKSSAIPDPSDTITFGEKKSDSSHVHMDFLQGGGNDIHEIDHWRHDQGANFAFADGSVRWLQGWGSLSPRNLWAITPEWRLTAIPSPE